MAFCVWLLSLSIACSGFIDYIAVCVSTSFFKWLSNIPLYEGRDHIETESRLMHTELLFGVLKTSGTTVVMAASHCGCV